MQDPSRIDGTFVRGVGVVALFATLTGVARVGQDAAIAWRFGTGPMVDAYYLLLSVANWPVAVSLSLLTVLVAPTDAALHRSDATSARRFRAELLGMVMLCAAAALPLAWWALQAVAERLGHATTAHASANVPTLIAVVPLGMTGALLSAWFVSRSRHELTLLEALPPLVLAGVLMAATPEGALYWGTSAGVAVQVLVMALVLRAAHDLPMPRLGVSSQAWHGFSQGAIAMLVGQLLFAFVPLVDAFFAARLGEGAMAAFSYANRLVLGLLGIAGLALQRVGLPMLSALSTQSPAASFAVARRWAVVVTIIGSLTGLAVALLAEPLVSLLFERGSFTASDRGQVAILLRYGMLQLPLYVGGMVLVTVMASMNARRSLALAATTGLGVKLLLNWILSPLLGVDALPVATAAMYLATSTVVWILLRLHVRSAIA